MQAYSALTASSARIKLLSEQLSAAFAEAVSDIEAAGASVAETSAAALEDVRRAARQVPALLGRLAKLRSRIHVLARPNPLAVPELLTEIARFLAPRDALALATASRATLSALVSVLCARVEFRDRGASRADLLLARDAEGAQRIGLVRDLDLGDFSVHSAFHSGILGASSTRLRRLKCEIRTPEDFAAFGLLALPHLAVLDVTVWLEADELDGDDGDPDLAVFGCLFPALRELRFRPASSLAWTVLKALDFASTLLDSVEIDFRECCSDDLEGIAACRDLRLIGAVRSMSFRWFETFEEVAQAGLEGIKPAEISVLRDDDATLGEFCEGFDAAWQRMCGMPSLVRFRSTYVAASGFLHGVPPALASIDAEVLDFDDTLDSAGASTLRRLARVRIEAEQYLLNGEVPEKPLKKLLRKCKRW
ncbi:hypothetical protein DFJ74DRAFT_712513 [Hyaloraphidium curvatum]|nr:hypothetical protein DFJ74DRAFT_712513 [Hyaloraphidium curvatum]